MDFRETFKGIQFFWKGLRAAKADMWASLQVLVIATFVLGTILYFVEHSAQPDVYANWYDPYIWGFMSYLGNPGKFSPGEPITVVGRFIAIIISIIKILIFAVPAGLVANGFRKAMADDKREKELAEIHRRLHKKFRRTDNKTMREFLNSLPDKGGEKYKTLNVVPQRQPISSLMMLLGVSQQDLFDVAKKHNEYCIRNLATAKGSADDAIDRFVVEHYPVNTSYGCCIDRKSNITIVSPSCYNENGTYWFAYYLAKFGGFNYVCKVIEVDMDEPDSFFNIKEEPVYEGKKKVVFNKKEVGYKVISKKEEHRAEFFKDLKRLNEGKSNAWTFILSAAIKNENNTADLHIVTNSANGANSTITDIEGYNKLLQSLRELYGEMDMECVETTRYQLRKNNLLYRMSNNENVKCNGVVLRPSTDVINFDHRSLLIAYRLAQVIDQTLSYGNGMLLEDIKELKSGFGYEINSVKRQKSS